MYRPLTLFIILSCLCRQYCAGQLTSQFTTDKSGGCGPLVIHFGNQTSGASANAGYQWNFGNGNMGVTPNPEATYTVPGSYPVTLTVTDGGQASTSSQTITVYPPPAVDFSASATQVCAPSPIQFTSTGGGGSSGGGTITWLWDFGDGTTQTGGPGVGHAYQAPGVMGVSLTVTDSYGCVATAVKPQLVTILPTMKVAFSTDKQVLCTATEPVQFTNNSTGPGTLTYQWSFGDGNGSTQTSPVYSYAQKGSYSVILTATSSAGCSAADTQTNLLDVANFQVNFTPPANVCAGASATLVDASVPAATRSVWAVDGQSVVVGNPATTLLLLTPGAHTMTLTDDFGACTQSLSKPFSVGAAPVPVPFDMNVSGKCGPPETVNFLDHTPGAVSWVWNFDYQTADPYPQNTTTGGPANSTVYGLNQNFDILLTVTNAAGCSASIEQVLAVSTPFEPIYLVSGTPQTCGQPMTETFGIVSPGQIQSYSWNFGDGTTSTSLQPTHTFTAPGNYQVTLNWTDLNGCTGVSNTLFVNVGAPFNVDFSATSTTVCVGAEVDFGGSSLATDGAYFTSWNFGDGSPFIFSPVSAVHIYNTPGVYTVTLNVENAGGCQESVAKTNYITVLPSPTLAVSATNTCTGNRGVVTFGVAAGGGATALAWDFGDGTTQNTDATIIQLTHTYTQTNAYIVSVTASNGTCTTTSTQNVTVLITPSLVFSADVATVCPNGTVEVFLTEPGPPFFFYPIQTNSYFQYGDRTIVQGGVQGTFANPDGGDYSWALTGLQGGESGLRVVTTNSIGCVDSSNFIPLVIGGAATGYEIEQDDRCYQLPVLLKDTTKVSPGNSILSWLWDFGDGQTSTQSGAVSHVYASPGSYTVKLTVQDNSGCQASSLPAVTQVTVNGPKAAFSSPSGNTLPEGSIVIFSNSTNTYGSTDIIWSWNFGDGSASSSSFSPTHVYALPGTYVVTMTAQDAVSGCASVATLTLVIQPVNSAFSTAASYIASGTCPPVLAQFTNTSVNYTSISWDFGDGETVANVPDPSHVYKNPGKYIVTLTVVGDNGQTIVTLDSVIVAQPSAVLSTTTTALCVGQAATLQARSNQRVAGYTWDFGDGSVATGASFADSNITHVYTVAGQYDAKLIVTDTPGCAVAAAAGIEIDVHTPPVVGVTPPQGAVCFGGIGETLTAIGGVTYSWSPPTGLSATDIASPVATPLVNTTYTVTVADAIGCSDSGTVAVTVIQPEKLSVSPDSVALCPGKTVELVASGTDEYNWIGAVAGLSATDIANPVARPAATGVYTVTGGDTHSCFSDTAFVLVNVLSAPAVNAGPDLVVQGGTPVTIEAEASSDVVGWQWTPALYLSCTDCAQPACVPKQTETYVVTVTSVDGCTNADTVVVQLLCEASKVRIPDAFTPNGDGHNDRWNILGISQVNHLVIYDRWGVKVFERNHFYPADVGAGWDGTMNGQPAPPGVYAYFVEMQCATGGVFTRKGTVLLVR